MGEPFGVYLHVPFCASRCDYCAFATWTDRDHLMSDYAAACATEIGRALFEGELRPANSVFVGGGTPSRLPGAMLADVLGGVPTAPGAEVTAECNPEGATDALFTQWRSAGVTRVSFGVQSIQAHVLAGLGRRHDRASVGRALALAAAHGFEVNVDLIFGGAGEQDADWQRTLEAVLALEPRPAHVSAYALTVEPGTPLARQPARHPDEEVLARRYVRAEEVLSEAGYRWYEVSNWALPGHECRHNQLYWRQGDYRGIGCSAHSHASGRRWWNIRSVDRYVAAIASGRPATAGEEVLDDQQRAFETLALSLRTTDGVPSGAVPDDPDLSAMLTRRGDRAVLTVRGRLVADEVTRRLRVPTILRA